MDDVDRIIERALIEAPAITTFREMAVLAREQIEAAGYVITTRPDVGDNPDGFLPIYKASTQ